MNLLALDSSGLTASAAVMMDGMIASEYTVNNKKTHSQTLLPMIDEVMKAAGIAPKDLDCIAVSKGPGSFTGLRIGSATAKGLGFALDIPIAEVSTLDALGYNLCGNEGCIICPIMDARRQEVYTAAYEFVPGESKTDPDQKTLIPEQAVALQEMLKKLEAFQKKVIFNGDGVDVYKDVIAKDFASEHAFAPKPLLLQRASSVAVLGEKIFIAGEAVNADMHVPVYLRKSQAEREREMNA